MAEPEDRAVEGALDAERQFVLTLGGFALEIPGAILVTNERLPVPRFNFVQELGVGPERQAAFFERALDHYFQRALRPTFRVPLPAAPHIDAGLRRFGFRPRAEPLVLLLHGRVGDEELPRSAERRRMEVRAASLSELDVVAAFWTSERERPEFRAALHVAWTHPNPHERLQPVLGFHGVDPVSAALVYRYRGSASIHAVATRPSARGQGAASEVVRFAVDGDPVGPGVRYSIFADSPRLRRRLEELGFRAARSFVEYELPTDASLSFPSPGPAGPPQWRPPRKGRARTE